MIGFAELTLIIILAIIFLGPEGMTKTARTLAKVYVEYRRAMYEFQKEIVKAERELELENEKKNDSDKVMYR